MPRRGFKRRSCLDCWRRKVSCDVVNRRRNGLQGCSTCIRRNLPCRMEPDEVMAAVGNSSPASLSNPLQQTEHPTTDELVPSEQSISDPSPSMELLLASSAAIFADASLMSTLSDWESTSSPFTPRTSGCEQTRATTASPSTPNFFQRPWLVSHLLHSHSQDVQTALPLLHMATHHCNLIKAGLARENRSDLLSHAQSLLQSAMGQSQYSPYDILASTVTLSEVWDQTPLEAEASCNDDIKSLRVMSRLSEICLCKGPFTSSASSSGVKENPFIYWTVYVLDAFEALATHRLPTFQHETVQALRHKYPLRSRTDLAPWFSSLCDLASIAREIASTFWIAAASSKEVPLGEQELLFQKLQDYKQRPSAYKARDDFLSLLRHVCYNHLHFRLQTQCDTTDLQAVLLHRRVETAALEGILIVRNMVQQASQTDGPTMFDQARAAPFVVIGFSCSSLQHVERHVASNRFGEQTGLLQTARILLDAVENLDQINIDPDLRKEMIDARQELSRVQSLHMTLLTFARPVQIIAPP